MSATSDLTSGYGKFFKGCLYFSFSPYIYTSTAFVKRNSHGDQLTQDFAWGVGLCIVLSTVIPVLPELCSFTLSLGMLAASLAVSSMFLAYPITLLMDALSNDFGSEGYRGNYR